MDNPLIPRGKREALDDRYQLEEQVASGGMAGIWRATDLRTGDAVAVKILQLSADPRLQEDDPGRRILKIVSETPPLPSQRCPSVPAGLEDIGLRAMMRAPADRFQSAEEMRAALLANRSRTWLT